MQGSPSETMPDKITPSTEAPVSLDATTLPEESVTFITEASCPPSLQPDMPSVEASLILEEPDNLTGMLSDHSERPTSSLEGSSSPSEEASSPVEAEKGSNASEGGDDEDSTADKTGDKGPIPESPATQVNESGKSKKKKKKRSKAPRFTKQQVEEGATPDCCGVANVASAEAPSAHPTLLAPGGADSPLVKALQVTTNPLASNLTLAVNGPTETTSKKKKKSKAKPRGPVVEKPPEGAGHMPQVVPMQDATQKGKPQAPEGSKESTKKKSKSKNKAGRAPDPGNPETSGTPCPSTNISVPSGLLPCPGLIPKAKLVKEPVLELKDSTGVDVAEFLTDILKNNPRDRMFLLKMEQDILEFIKDSNANIHSLSPMTSYHRLLAHRVATHFGLEHAVLGPKGTTLMLHKTANTRIPLQRFKEHFAVEESSPTPRKLILKRESPPASSQQSHGPAMALDRRSKSLEEREEEYRLARERIFNQSPMQSEPSKPNGNGKGEKSGERSAPPGKVGGLGVRRMHSADAEPGSWHPSRAGVSVLRRAESAGEGGGIATHATSAAAQMNVAEAAAHFGESRCSTLVNCQSQMPRGPALPQDGGRMVHMRGGDPRFSGQTQPSAGVCYPAGPPSQQALLNHWALQRSPFLPAGGVPSPGHAELPCGQSPQHGHPAWGRNNNNNHHQAPGPSRSTQMHGGHAGHGNRGHTSTGNRALQQQQSQSFSDVDGTQGLREQQYMGLQHTPTSSSSSTMPHQHHNQQWRGPQPNPYQAMCNTAVPLGSMGAQCSHKQFASSVAQAWQPDAQTAHGASSTGQSMPMNLRTPDLREGTNGPGTQHHYGLTGPVRNPAHAKQNSQNVPRGQIQYRHWPPGHMDHYSTQSVQGQYPMHPGPGSPGNYSSQNARGHYSTQGPLGHVGHYPSQGGRVAGPGGHGLQHVMPNGTSLMPPSHHEGVSFHAHTLSGMLGPGGCPIAREAEGAMHQLNISPPASAERGSRRGGGSSGWEMSLMYSADKGSSQVPGGSQLQEACAPTQHARTDGPPARPPPAWYPQQYSSATLHSGHGNTGLDHRLAVGVATSDVPNGYPHALASTIMGGTTKPGKRKGRGKKGARQPPLAPPERLHSQSHIQPHMMEMQR
ncbi:uncharacterized protein LOC144724939 isoform X2 [Lampetra planeri]